jgi:hypothetical protein
VRKVRTNPKAFRTFSLPIPVNLRP